MAVLIYTDIRNVELLNVYDDGPKKHHAKQPPSDTPPESLFA